MNENYYSKFKRVYETSDSIEANEYLELGWVLLNVVKAQIAEESWSTYYILGWDGEVAKLKRGRTYRQRLDEELKKYNSESADSDNMDNNDLNIPF